MRSVSSALAVAVMVVAAHAASGQSATQSAKSMTDSARAARKLTAQQKAEIRKIHQEYNPQERAERKDIHTDEAALRDARKVHDTSTAHALHKDIAQDRKQLGAMNRAERDSIRGDLTPAQRRAYNRNLRDRRDDRQDIRKDRRDVVGDKRDIARDSRDIAEDKREIRQDRKDGDKKELVRDERDLRQDKRDLRQDSGDVKRDRRDLRKDKRDLRKDRKHAP